MSLHAPSPIDVYRMALEVLDTAASLQAEEAIAILCARDAVYQSLIEYSLISGDRLLQVQTLDAKLKAHSKQICGAIDLPIYRSIHPNTAQKWWWHLDTESIGHRRERNDWLLQLLTIGSWTAILALLLNITNRFFSVGLGVTGAMAVIFPSLLAFLKARSDLTEAGRRSLERLLTGIGIPKHRHSVTKFGLTLVLLGIAIGLWCSLPAIAAIYNEKGLALYDRQHLRQAEQHYQQAIALDSDHATAHYNLGLVYEDWLRLGEAKAVYQIAASQGLVEAHNNLARLLIRSEDYQEAVLLIQSGLLLRDRTEVPPEDEFSLYKNLGWARLSQGDGYLQEAKSALDEAISIDKTKLDSRNGTAAHCLLAQVLEKQSKADDSIEHWQMCCQQGIDRIRRKRTPVPEEDRWLHLAKERLQTQGKSCPSPDTTL